jgi:glycosyltransferase involved in cell wall biosynthesis
VTPAVADVIELAATRTPVVPELGPREISIFTETRFAKRPDGRWSALDPASRGQRWDRYTQDGDTVRVVARADWRPSAGSAPVPDEVTLVPLPYYVGVRGLVRKLLPVMRSVTRAVTQAETIVLRVPGVMGSIAAFVCWLLRRNYAVEVVGDPADVLRAGVLGRLGNRLSPLAEAQMRWLVRHAAASLYVTRETLQNRYPRRPGTPTVAMSNVLLSPQSLATQGRNWQPGPFRVVTIGSQENHYKGHDVLLKALRELVDGRLDVTATIIGGGRAHEELVELAHSMGLGSRVLFTGTIDDRARIEELLDSASLFVLPSRTEGMPRALIEAMARALPAVGSDVGGIPELLSPSCLVPAGDHVALAKAMAGLLSDPQRWEEQSRDNLKIAHTFAQSLLEERFSAWLSQIPPARRGGR